MPFAKVGTLKKGAFVKLKRPITKSMLDFIGADIRNGMVDDLLNIIVRQRENLLIQ